MASKKSTQIQIARNGVGQATILKMAMRNLWLEQVLWTRDYLVAAVAESSSASVSSKRLLRNQLDIGAAFVPYYGKKAGEKLTRLLTEHVQVTAEIIEAARAEKSAKFMAADLRWVVNANEIAAFLAECNPHWSRDNLAELLARHLKLTKDELGARLLGRWEAEITAVDDICAEIISFADTLSDGIVKQFPGKF